MGILVTRPIGPIGAGIGGFGGLIGGGGGGAIVRSIPAITKGERISRAIRAISDGMCPDPCDDAFRRREEAEKDAKSLKKRGFGKGLGCTNSSGNKKQGLTSAGITERIRILSEEFKPGKTK